MPEVPMIEYTCRLCGDKFPAPQGSKRNLCPKCLTERVTAGKKPKKEE